MAVADRRTTTAAVASARPGPSAPVALGLGLAVLATLVWSGSFVTSRALGDSVPPVQHAFWRWVVALAVVAPFG
ncbi:EamA family transporter, partial [Streptomyces sp. 4F]